MLVRISGCGMMYEILWVLWESRTVLYENQSVYHLRFKFHFIAVLAFEKALLISFLSFSIFLHLSVSLINLFSSPWQTQQLYIWLADTFMTNRAESVSEFANDLLICMKRCIWKCLPLKKTLLDSWSPLFCSSRYMSTTTLFIPAVHHSNRKEKRMCPYGCWGEMLYCSRTLLRHQCTSLSNLPVPVSAQF